MRGQRRTERYLSTHTCVHMYVRTHARTRAHTPTHCGNIGGRKKRLRDASRPIAVRDTIAGWHAVRCGAATAGACSGAGCAGGCCSSRTRRGCCLRPLGSAASPSRSARRAWRWRSCRASAGCGTCRRCRPCAACETSTGRGARMRCSPRGPRSRCVRRCICWRRRWCARCRGRCALGGRWRPMSPSSHRWRGRFRWCLFLVCCSWPRTRPCWACAEFGQSLWDRCAPALRCTLRAACCGTFLAAARVSARSSEAVGVAVYVSSRVGRAGSLSAHSLPPPLPLLPGT